MSKHLFKVISIRRKSKYRLLYGRCEKCMDLWLSRIQHCFGFSTFAFVFSTFLTLLYLEDILKFAPFSITDFEHLVAYYLLIHLDLLIRSFCSWDVSEQIYGFQTDWEESRRRGCIYVCMIFIYLFNIQLWIFLFTAGIILAMPLWRTIYAAQILKYLYSVATLQTQHNIAEVTNCWIPAFQHFLKQIISFYLVYVCTFPKQFILHSYDLYWETIKCNSVIFSKYYWYWFKLNELNQI